MKRIAKYQRVGVLLTAIYIHFNFLKKVKVLCSQFVTCKMIVKKMLPNKNLTL